MTKDSEKIDKRKFNKGRNSKKLEGTENSNETKDLNQIEIKEPEIINNQIETTMSDIKPNDIGDNKNTTEGSEEIVSKSSDISDAVIIDETKLSDVIKDKDKAYTPVNDKVQEEAYRNPYKGQGNPDEDIAEPIIKKPDMNMLNTALNGKAKTNDDKSAPENKGIGTPMAERSGLTEAIKNDDLKFATPEEKRLGAEQLVAGVLDAYAMLHQFGAWIATINIDKLVEKEIDGKIDLSIAIPINETETITLKAFIENYNHEAKKTIVVDPDFIEKVRPIMIRVCEKNGWGLTDEQYLIYLFGRDIAEKTALIVAMKRAMNVSLRIIEKTYIKFKNTNNNINDNNNNGGDGGQQQTNTNQPTNNTPSNDNIITKSNVSEAEVVSETIDETKGGLKDLVTFENPDEMRKQ